MASYADLIGQDVYKSCDVTSWPPTVSKFVQSLQNELKIPKWFKSFTNKCTNKSILELVDQVWVSSDVSSVDLWDHTDGVIDTDMEQRLYTVFNTALVDCARIRKVIETENITDVPFPMESFLVTFVRNAAMNLHAKISSLEDVPVVLPRHFSGEEVPILWYMAKKFYGPLIISICQEMPVEESEPDSEDQSSDEEEDSVEESEPDSEDQSSDEEEDSVEESEHDSEDQSSDEEEDSVESPVTLRRELTISEFLNGSETTVYEEEVEEVREEDILSPLFEAHFVAYSPSATSPSVCHIPVLCMADEERLPLLMSSLLYQRRVWHINDPLIGFEFSKYSTTVKLFVGWFEEDVDSNRVLPRIHLGEIRTTFDLDLSLPSVAIVVSRLLFSLESHVHGVCDSISRSVDEVLSEIQSHSSLSWRIDTGIEMEESVSILENHRTQFGIVQWIQGQKNSMDDDIMPPCMEVGKTELSPSPQRSTSRQPSYSSTPSSVISAQESLPAPEHREPHADDDNIPTLRSPFSCSAFAATTKEGASRVYRWMFDRRAVPQSIPFDLEFREEYNAMTGFIWPETWRVREDLPPVDAALEPCVRGLLNGVAALEQQPGGVKRIAVEEFPIDLRILEQSFSAIFQASRRSREHKELQQGAYEVAWRHDHDRLLFDFFKRLVQPVESDADTPNDSCSIAHPEDPLSRPTLETTLRFPKNDFFQIDDRSNFQYAIDRLVNGRPTDLKSWLQDRSSSYREFYYHEINCILFDISQWSFWCRVTQAETEAAMISKLGESPLTGKCDAFGRLLVELPNVSLEDVGHFPLVVRAAGKHDDDRGGKKSKASPTGSRAQPDERQGKASIKTASNTSTVPDVSPPFTTSLSSLPPPIQDLDKRPTGSVGSVDAFTFKTQQPHSTHLELPILTAAYKKASDSVIKNMNQVRMYLVSSVKFLQAIGITNMPVYGVETDGPIVVLPAAIVRDDDFVYVFERLAKRLDISTPVGAWHYATVLCRLAQNHAKFLESRFEQVKDGLAASLRERSRADGWTMEEQIAGLKSENRAKSPPQKTSGGQEPEAN